MPGAYAHLTLVNLAREPHRLTVADIPPDVGRALMRNLKYVELGAVSPDLPYLTLDLLQWPPGLDARAKQWADKMHYERTGEVLASGLRLLRDRTGPDWEKGVAWLFGYAAHVAADLTIHPVVELKVGPYHANQQNHRRCEMYQDAHVFYRLNLGDIGDSEHLDSGIKACIDNSGSLDGDIEDLWKQILAEVYPEGYRSNEPQPAEWHAGFASLLDTVEEGTRLFAWARHVGAHTGISYTTEEDIDSTFIEDLEVPGGGRLHYDALFDQAIDNVLRFWAQLAEGLIQPSAPIFAQLGHWNLDTGRDTETEEYVFWGVA